MYNWITIFNEIVIWYYNDEITVHSSEALLCSTKIIIYAYIYNPSKLLSDKSSKWFTK